MKVRVLAALMASVMVLGFLALAVVLIAGALAAAWGLAALELDQGRVGRVLGWGVAVLVVTMLMVFWRSCYRDARRRLETRG